jgi:predicted nucleic acid-binding protein
MNYLLDTNIQMNATLITADKQLLRKSADIKIKIIDPLNKI